MKESITKGLSPRRKAYDLTMRVLLYTSAVLICALLVFLIGYILYRGIPHLSWQFLTSEESVIKDIEGILPAILNTVYVIIATLIFILPLGVGSGKWHMIRTVVLPSSVDGIVTGCILAVGRIVGESAVLMFTAGMGTRLAKYGDTVGEFFKNLFDSSGATLTVALYNYAKERADFDSAFAVAVVLLVIAFAINIAAKLAGKKLKKR